MKTGILTFHETTNFGSLLQTYALYIVLQNENVDCDIIDYQCEEINKREFKYENIDNSNIKNLIKFLLFSHQSRKKHKALSHFLQQNATLSTQYDKENIDKANNKYDCFIAGSDIVWGLDVTNNDLTYFLNFVKDDKLRMSYASSANEIIENAYTTEILQQLKKFSLISVRERKTEIELKTYFPDKVRLVCDPTMLLKSDYWIDLAMSSSYRKILQNSKYVLLYFPDGDGKMLKDAKKIKKEKNMKVYCINDKILFHGVKNIRISKVEDFLCFILYSELVLSGSYHGCLFSMYFKKDFYYYVRAHGERMNSLSNILEIQNRQAQYLDMNRHIDYSVLCDKINLFREQSYVYINEMIGKMKEYEMYRNNM